MKKNFVKHFRTLFQEVNAFTFQIVNKINCVVANENAKYN